MLRSQPSAWRLGFLAKKFLRFLTFLAKILAIILGKVHKILQDFSRLWKEIQKTSWSSWQQKQEKPRSWQETQESQDWTRPGLATTSWSPLASQDVQHQLQHHQQQQQLQLQLHRWKNWTFNTFNFYISPFSLHYAELLVTNAYWSPWLLSILDSRVSSHLRLVLLQSFSVTMIASKDLEANCSFDNSECSAAMTAELTFTLTKHDIDIWSIKNLLSNAFYLSLLNIGVCLRIPEAVWNSTNSYILSSSFYHFCKISTNIWMNIFRTTV